MPLLQHGREDNKANDVHSIHLPIQNNHYHQTPLFVHPVHRNKLLLLLLLSKFKLITPMLKILSSHHAIVLDL
jgi:hypothetical protein